MYVILQFGDIGLPIYNTDYDISPPAAQLAFVQTTNGVFDGNGAGRNRQAFPQNISYKAIVDEDTYANNQGTLDDLRAAVGTRALLYRGADSDTSISHSCVARLVSMPYSRPFSMRGYFEITLNFQQLTPWVGDRNGAGWRFDSGILFDDGRVFDETEPFALVGASTLISVTNGGNLPATDVVVQVNAGATDNLESLTVWNMTTNCRFYWSGLLTIPGSLRIDSAACSVLANGADDFNSFVIDEPFHRNEHWMEIAPGTNQIAVVRFGGGIDSTIAFVFDDVWA